MSKIHFFHFLVVFPQDLLEKGLDASNFAMLGLGDIVIPGIFIALLLRFDNRCFLKNKQYRKSRKLIYILSYESSLKRKSNFYFNATFFAYFMGLVATILVMHLYRHAQPALLYLVPACLGTPLFLALVRGDIKTLFK